MTNGERERLERAARKSVEERYGRPLSNEEWAEAKHALLEIGRLLRDWQHPKDQDHEPS